MYVFMGGTFDPVHEGHIQGALQVSEFLNNSKVHLLPTKVPVHKSAPLTSVDHRIAMLELAVKPYQQLLVDLREIKALEPSFTISTLQSLRMQVGEKESIVMVIGMDSFLTLEQWKRSNEFLSLCHILVLQRPHYDLDNTHPFVKYRTDDKTQLLNEGVGRVFFLTQPPFDISATEIREKIESKTSNGYIHQKLSKTVNEYIHKNNLYK